MQHIIPVEALSEDKAAITEKVVEEDFQAQQRSSINILSDDEGYLLEEDQSIAKTEFMVDSCKEFSTLENKTVRHRRKKNKIEVIAPYWRPKTRPTNKLRWNMKKLLNPMIEYQASDCPG